MLDLQSGEQRKAIWIASYPKSGNTWLRIFLNNLMRGANSSSESAQSINALDEWSGRESLIADFARRLGKPAREATPAEIAAVRPLVQADVMRGYKAGKPAFIKTHNAVATVEGSPTINFDITKCGIYIVRNPLDIAISFAHHLGSSIDTTIEYMADTEATTQLADEKRVYEFISSWSHHVASWLSIPHRPILILRYEDMVSAPERSFGRVVSFLNINADREQLQKAIENSEFRRLEKQEKEYGFRERPASSKKFFRSGKSGQWKEDLSQQQVNSIIKSHASMMMRFGYLTETCDLGQPAGIGEGGEGEARSHRSAASGVEVAPRVPFD